MICEACENRSAVVVAPYRKRTAGVAFTAKDFAPSLSDPFPGVGRLDLCEDCYARRQHYYPEFFMPPGLGVRT
jgi:hypothetical protein